MNTLNLHSLLITASNSWQVTHKNLKIKQWWHALVVALTAPPELHANWRRDRQGHICLEIYDPITNQYWQFPSEQAARIWIEHRYNAPSN